MSPQSIETIHTSGPLDNGQPKVDVHKRRQAAFVAIGRRAIAPPAIPIFVQDSAVLVAESLGAPFYGIAELLADQSTLELKLFEHDLSQKAPDPLVTHRSSIGAGCICSFALESSRPVACGDLEIEMRFQDPFLRSQGIASALVSPLILKDRSFGAICIFDRQRRDFSADEVQFVETLTHLVTTAIAREQAERALQEERRFNSRVLETIEALVLVLEPSGLILKTNRACEDLTGFSLEELKGRSIWTSLLVESEVDHARQVFQQLNFRGKPYEFESDVLTKGGDRRRVAWSCTLSKGGDGQPPTIIGTGVDVTEERNAQSELAKAHRAASQSTGSADPELSAADRRAQEIARESEKIMRERRNKARRSYPYMQLIARMGPHNELPSLTYFSHVECRDIGIGGFSFFTPTIPTFKNLVVALGTPPVLTYMKAEIAHVSQSTHNGYACFVVGCKYTGRVTYSGATPPQTQRT